MATMVMTRRHNFIPNYTYFNTLVMGVHCGSHRMSTNVVSGLPIPLFRTQEVPGSDFISEIRFCDTVFMIFSVSAGRFQDCNFLH